MGKRLINFLGIFSIFLFLVTGAIILTIWSVPMYEMFVRILSLNGLVGLEVDQVVYNYFLLLVYLNCPWVNQLELPDFPISDSARFHFVEVKHWFLICYLLCFVGLAAGIIYLFKLRRRKECWRLVRPFGLLALVMAGLGFFLVAGNFDWVFTSFHQLLFNNNAWIFDPRTDPIILVLPEVFFLACFVLVFGLTFLGCLALANYGRKSIKTQFESGKKR